MLFIKGLLCAAPLILLEVKYEPNQELFAKVKAESGQKIEVHEHFFLQMVLEYLGIDML
jgi:hypothetical protein